MIGYAVEWLPEAGVNLMTGKEWRGWRVRYRKDGTRQWRSFLLTVDGDATPTEKMVEQAVRAHETGNVAA